MSRSGIQILVKLERPGEAAIEQLHTANFDHPVMLLDLETRGFRIEHDLPHRLSYCPASMRSIATLASWST